MAEIQDRKQVKGKLGLKIHRLSSCVLFQPPAFMLTIIGLAAEGISQSRRIFYSLYVAVQAADYLRFSVWRDGDRRKKQQMRDVLNV